MGLIGKLLEIMPHHNKLQPLAPDSSRITPYDRAQFKLYLLLLKAEQQGLDWRLVVGDIMGFDREDASARRCWLSHLQRAKWMSEIGYRQLIDSTDETSNS